MTASFSPWRRTGERCKRGAAIEVRTVRTYIAQGQYPDEIEQRCCPECEAEGE
jgi:hypothetical protein